MDMKFYLSLFLRRLPYFLVLVALGTALGLTLASVLPPVYVARAVLLLESEQIPDNLAASTVNTRPAEQLQIIQQRILTRAELLELANRLAIYAPAPGRAARSMSADEIVEDMRRRTTISSGGGGGAAPRGAPAAATLITVSFEAPTAAMSALVTNELVTMILNENVSMRTGVAGQTLDFFVQEVARLDQELAVRGAAILDFQQKNSKALPESLNFRRSQQAAAQERLLQLSRDETALKDRRTTLVTLYEQTGEVAPTEALTPEAQQLKTMRDQLSQALAIYAPQNPRVKLLQQQITSMEKAVAAQLPSAAATAGTAGTPPSAYELQLADIDSQLQFILQQKTEVNATLADLAATIDATPGNAIALDTLQRDLAAVRSQYDAAVQNRARAQTGDLIETLSKGQRISIIEQAVAPREPTRPHRLMIAAAGIGGGIVLGLGLILLLEVLNRSIRRPVDLTNKLGITPFATLPYVRTRSEIRFRRLAIALALLVVLGGIPASLWAVNTYYMPLDMAIERGINKLGLTEVAAQIRASLGQ